MIQFCVELYKILSWRNGETIYMDDRLYGDSFLENNIVRICDKNGDDEVDFDDGATVLRTKGFSDNVLTTSFES